MTDDDYIKQYEEQTMGFFHGCFGTIILMLIFAACIIFAVSCKNTEYIPIETVRTEYVNTTDTVRQIDSVYHEKETIIKEVDSATMARYGIQMKNAERAWLVQVRELEDKLRELYEHKADTVIRSDTISIPVPVEKRLSRWQRTCMTTGKIAFTVIGTLAVMGIAYAVWWLRRRKK